MAEQITIKGTRYNVVWREAAADIPGAAGSALLRIGARGHIYLVKAQHGTHVLQAIERGDGTIGALTDTRRTIDGASIYRTRAA